MSLSHLNLALKKHKRRKIPTKHNSSPPSTHWTSCEESRCRLHISEQVWWPPCPSSQLLGGSGCTGIWGMVSYSQSSLLTFGGAPGLWSTSHFQICTRAHSHTYIHTSSYRHNVLDKVVTDFLVFPPLMTKHRRNTIIPSRRHLSSLTRWR